MFPGISKAPVEHDSLPDAWRLASLRWTGGGLLCSTLETIKGFSILSDASAPGKLSFPTAAANRIALRGIHRMRTLALHVPHRTTNLCGRRVTSLIIRLER